MRKCGKKYGKAR